MYSSCKTAPSCVIPPRCSDEMLCRTVERGARFAVSERNASKPAAFIVVALSSAVRYSIVFANDRIRSHLSRRSLSHLADRRRRRRRQRRGTGNPERERGGERAISSDRVDRFRRSEQVQLSDSSLQSVVGNSPHERLLSARVVSCVHERMPHGLGTRTCAVVSRPALTARLTSGG